jgi:hypothetical protein
MIELTAMADLFPLRIQPNFDGSSTTDGERRIDEVSLNIFGQCDGFGASYATIFRIHGASDVDVATQRSGMGLASPVQRFSKYTVQI